ncbi:MAG: hypothetical protein HY670_09765 [Chloroflexi bacterium]|nr:hypothetical protein [Chloroflexota bacterium]
MNQTRVFLGVALPIAVVIAIIGLFLPEDNATTYYLVLQPLSLLVGAILAIYVSAAYRKEFKAAMMFCSAYLLLFMLAIILLSRNLLGSFFIGILGQNFGALVWLLQLVTYAMLVFFAINVLRVVNLRQLNRGGWALFVITVVVSLFIAIYPVMPLLQSARVELATIWYVIIRLVDAALVIFLVPVLWLYIQFMKSRQKQSLTFTVLILGVICATVFDYLFQSVLQIFPGLLAESSMLRTAIPNFLYLLGYLIIAVGLYAHRKQDEWGYNAIDKALG